jgi:mRNA-degrading endonuclease YafQ of YafQ-DinJ toxin-antitoxin module
MMMHNPRHPSLHTKKIQGHEDIFEASITMDIRMTWQYMDDGILLRNIGEHDKTLKKP